MSHNKKCFARAILCAVENNRDLSYMRDEDFALAARQNDFYHEALAYLADGTIDCVCHELTPVGRLEWIIENYDQAVGEARLKDDTIPPSWSAVPPNRVRVARLARVMYGQELRTTLDAMRDCPAYEALRA